MSATQDFRRPRSGSDSANRDLNDPTRGSHLLPNSSAKRRRRRPAIQYQVSKGPILDGYHVDAYGSIVVRHFTPDCELPLTNTQMEFPQSRMCGSWVRLLPDLARASHPRHGVLPKVLRALGCAIMSKMTPNAKPIPDPVGLYCEALHSVRDVIAGPRKLPHTQVLASSMCLALTEVSHTHPSQRRSLLRTMC